MNRKEGVARACQEEGVWCVHVRVRVCVCVCVCVRAHLSSSTGSSPGSTVIASPMAACWRASVVRSVRRNAMRSPKADRLRAARRSCCATVSARGNTRQWKEGEGRKSVRVSMRVGVCVCLCVCLCVCVCAYAYRHPSGRQRGSPGSRRPQSPPRSSRW